MKQLPLFPDMQHKNAVVNVASVPHRSPFRYPGGKTWLVPLIRRWLSSLSIIPQQFIEPFAGGAIVGLSVAFENLAPHVLLVELDNQVAAVWQTIIESNQSAWLSDQIVSFDFTLENVVTVLNTIPQTTQEYAFQTIVKNRVNHGGILAAGAGKLKRGEAGKGIRSRWYPATLRRRILDIAAIRSHLSFVHGDGIRIIQRYCNDPNVVFFIDPPYTVAGKKAGHRLYTHSDLDHEALFQLASSLAGEVLMTYDDTPAIHEMAARYHLDVRPTSMKNTHHARQTELLIGRNLSWVT